jgi:hypothetical protein
MHHALVFLEDTPPLPNALGPGSKPGLIFCQFLFGVTAKAGRMAQKFPLVLPKGTR